jgi:hypothetical protein
MAHAAQQIPSEGHIPSFGIALVRFAVAFPVMTAAMVFLSALAD